jgi:hypothetical protein
MAQMNLNLLQQQEDRIDRKQREGRNVRIDKSKSVLFQVGTGKELSQNLRPAQFEWRCAFFQESKSALTGVNTSVTPSRLAVNTTDNGTGVFDLDARTWTDAGKWIGKDRTDFYLKVDSEYYRILSNTDDALTLGINIGVYIDDGNYNVVPFIPNSLVETVLRPDITDDQIYVILSNTETEIFIAEDRGESFNVASGAVTTGDAGAPHDTFDDIAFGSNIDDQWNDYSVYFYTGNNEGESALISDFQTTTGRFVLASGLTNPIVAGDRFRLRKSLLWVGVGATFSIENYVPSNTDFEDAVAPPQLRFLGSSPDGAIDDQQMPTPYLGMYSAEVYVAGRKSFGLDVDYVGAIRIQTLNMSTGERLEVFSSPVRSRNRSSVLFSIPGRTYTRIEIYYYSPEVMFGTLKVSGITQFLNSWRDLTASAPTWVDVSGADSGGVDDPSTMLEGAIELEWFNNAFLRENGKTEIYISDTEGGTYALNATVLASETSRAIPFQAGTTKWFKLRHVSASGVNGGFTVARKGAVATAGNGEADVSVQWSDNVGTQVFANENGWFNNSILRAKITAASDLDIADIKYQEAGQSEQSLGATSPVLAPAIVTEQEASIRVRVVFTNGFATDWKTFNFRYDKTAPTAPVFVLDSGSAENYEVKVPIDSGGVDSLSGFSVWEWTYNFTGADPISSDPAILDTVGDEFRKGFSDYNLTTPNLYLWARSVDNAGNKSAWVQYNGASGFLNMNESEILGSYEERNIHEFARAD